MGRNIDDVIQGLPTDRQAKIAALSREKIEEMIAHARTLTDFRKALGKTQAEVARELGINQNAISQLEKRSDTYVSTLRRFLKTLGLSLELSVTDSNGVRIDLPNFLEGSHGSDRYDAKALAAPAKRAQKTAAGNLVMQSVARTVPWAQAASDASPKAPSPSKKRASPARSKGPARKT